ncbi:TPA: metal-dependent hydrolase [Candidatus Woesearchaeota archaeon]|nr:metal-dependent hydrolase [Candidatus Woesearchaeota archaeon]
MAYAVTHVLIPLIILDLLRHYLLGKKKFPRYLIIVGGIAGLVPDIDLPLGGLINLLAGTELRLHGLFTHSVLFVIIFALVGFLCYWWNNQKWAKIFLVICFGWLMHIFLDCLFRESVTRLLFWPLQWGDLFCASWNLYPYALGIDAILLVLWLVHEEIHHYIKDYF